MTYYIKSFDEFVNEALLAKQIPYILKLKPGDVIFAKESFNIKNDVNFARMSDSFIGKIKMLNSRNMLKDDRSDWGVAEKGDVVSVVLSTGEMAFKGGWSCNIKDKQQDYILTALNILMTDDKIDVRSYNKNNDEERLMVFKNNLFYGQYNGYGPIVNVLSSNIEFSTQEEKSYKYNKVTDELIIYKGFDIETGGGGKIMKIKDASKNDSIEFKDGKLLNMF